MKLLTAISGSAVALIIFVVGSIILPSIGFIPDVGTVLTVATFLFAIFAGFYISRLSARYDKIRECVAGEDATFLTLYQTSRAFGVKFANQMRDLIDEYYVIAYDHLLTEYTYKQTVGVFISMWDLAVLKKDKEPSSAYQNLLSYLGDIEQSRNVTATVSQERMPIAQWVSLTILAFIIIICLFQMRTFEFSSHVLTVALSTLVVMVLFIMRDLEQLRLGGGSLLEESGQEVLEMIGKPRYYNHVFIENGVSIMPSTVKSYRLGLHNPGDAKRVIKVVKVK